MSPVVPTREEWVLLAFAGNRLAEIHNLAPPPSRISRMSDGMLVAGWRVAAEGRDVAMMAHRWADNLNAALAPPGGAKGEVIDDYPDRVWDGSDSVPGGSIAMRAEVAQRSADDLFAVAGYSVPRGEPRPVQRPRSRTRKGGGAEGQPSLLDVVR